MAKYQVNSSFYFILYFPLWGVAMADGRKRIIQFHDIIFLPLIEQALDSHAGPSKQFYFISLRRLCNYILTPYQEFKNYL